MHPTVIRINVSISGAQKSTKSIDIRLRVLRRRTISWMDLTVPCCLKPRSHVTKNDLRLLQPLPSQLSLRSSNKSSPAGSWSRVTCASLCDPRKAGSSHLLLLGGRLSTSADDPLAFGAGRAVERDERANFRLLLFRTTDIHEVLLHIFPHPLLVHR